MDRGVDAAGVPWTRTQHCEALSHPQTLARGMVVDLVHPQAGPTKQSAARCTSQPHDCYHATGAAAGEHTRSLLLDYAIPARD